MGNANMSNDLTELATWADALLIKFNPAQRCQLLRHIAQDLRRSQAGRIASQQAPDGTAYTPRKHRKNLRGEQGRIKRQKATMFNKLRIKKYSKMQIN
jgi:phage virion morphogenesis protein